MSASVTLYKIEGRESGEKNLPFAASTVGSGENCSRDVNVEFHQVLIGVVKNGLEVGLH